MKDVIITNKIKGLDIQVGETINYDPESNNYFYYKEDSEESEGFKQVSSIYLELPINYIQGMVEVGAMEYVGDDIKKLTDQEKFDISMEVSGLDKSVDNANEILAELYEQRAKMNEYFDSLQAKVIDRLESLF